MLDPRRPGENGSAPPTVPSGTPRPLAPVRLFPRGSDPAVPGQPPDQGPPLLARCRPQAARPRPSSPGRAGRRGAGLRDGRQSRYDARTRPADHPRRAPARRPAAARRRGRVLAGGRPRPGQRAARLDGRVRRAGRGRPRSTGVAEQRPPRRDQVHVVGTAPLGDEVFRGALAARGRGRGRAAARRRAGWSSSSRTSATAPGHAGRTRSGWSAGSGGAGATTFACALALTAAARGRAALVDLTRSARGWTGWSASTTADRGPVGRRWPPAGAGWASRSLRCALPRRGRAGGADLGRRRARRRSTPATVREVLSAAQRGHDPCCSTSPRRWTTWSPRRSPAASGCCSWWRPPWPGSPRPAGWPPWLGPLTDRLGVVVRGAAVRSRPSRWPRRSACRWWPRCRTTARLAEHVDLGLGPVHARRCVRWPGRPAPCSTSVTPTSGRMRTARVAETVPAGVVEAVRERLARTGADAHPRGGGAGAA